MTTVCVRYLAHVRSATVAETAGGYESHIACQRALCDAFCGLYFHSTDSSVNAMESSWRILSTSLTVDHSTSMSMLFSIVFTFMKVHDENLDYIYCELNYCKMLW